MHDDFGDSDIAREHRIELLLAAFVALANGRPAAEEAGVFVGTAGLRWLREGGDFARDHLRVTAPRGSHDTPSVVVARLVSSSAMRSDSDFHGGQTSIGRIFRKP